MDSSEGSNKKMQDLNRQLMRVQQAYIQQKLKAIIVLEGVDAAGKGGLIRRLAWSMDPRALKVWPIGAPNVIEKEMHYLWRFWSKLPGPGEICVFDRSWYGRVLVERIENFVDKKRSKEAYEEINYFERLIISDDVRVVKVLLKISKKEQAKRLAERLNDEEKNWKLTFDDLRNRKKWSEYQTCYKEMVRKTSKKNAEWKIIESDNKEEARLEAITYIIKTLSDGISLKPLPLPKKLKREISLLPQR